MSTVIAGTRLHFGLFAADGRFGGCGLMIREPAVVLSINHGRDGWTSTGSLAERALGFARHIWRGTDTAGGHIHADGPPEHVGLGVGTALGLAVARGMAGCMLPSPKAYDQAKMVGRGRRSGIGVHGFRLGGFLVDAGKPAADALPELAGRCDFPAEWRVVLVRPRTAVRWSGDREEAVFHRRHDTTRAAEMSALALDTLLPAARAADFAGFTTALGEYNRRAGEPFAADQGGPYAGPQVTAVVETLKGWGWAGVGQSSWGPTVFVICPDEPSAVALQKRCWNQMPNLERVTMTAARNEPAAQLDTD
jgi:beta-RFAP synthase